MPTYEIPSELLLDACYPSVAGATPIPWWFRPCSHFTSSEDGRYLAYFIDPDSCGRNLAIMDLNTGELVYRTESFGVHNYEFLTNGKVLIAKGHCEGGGVSLFNPTTKVFSTLGGEGFYLWNPQHTMLAVRSMQYVGFEGKIWGYNVSENFLFLPEPETYQLDNHMLWTPDGGHLLYQHRAMIRVEGYRTDSFPTGRQIIRVDASTGEVKILAGDPDFDYHLCEGVRSSCDRWHGDWIQVRKYAYESQQLEYTGEDTPTTNCLFYGMECEGEATYFTLNWRTGEMIPWDESILPTPIPTITPTPGGERG